jgi:hypothetical protein
MTTTLQQPSTASTDLISRTGGLVNQAVSKGTGLLADRVEHYVNVAREVSDVLRERGEPQAAEFIDSAAGRVNSMARYLRNSDGSQLLSDAQAFAQGRTWFLAGLGLMGGMLAARAVRAANDSGTWGGQTPYVEQFNQERAR